MNPVADYVTGYKTNHTSIITANFKLQQDLGMFIKGLAFNGLFSYKNHSSSNATRVSDYNAFEVASQNDETGEYTLRRTGNERGTAIKTSGSHSGNRKLYLQATLDYKHTFGGVHDVNAMFLFNRQQYNTNNVTDLFPHCLSANRVLPDVCRMLTMVAIWLKLTLVTMVRKTLHQVTAMVSSHLSL